MKIFRSATRPGTALIITLISLAVFSLLGVVVYRIVRTQVKEVVYQERLAQSLYIAEAGLEDAMHEVYHNMAWRAGFSQKPFAGGYYTVKLSTDTPPFITSTGYSKNIAMFGRAFTTVGIRAEVSYSTATATYAIMANSQARVLGPARINAYYPNLNPDPPGFSFGAGIWSNSNVTTTAGSYVDGNVYYLNTVSLAPGTVFGNVLQVSAAQTLSNNTCGACKKRNDNLTITPASCYNAGTMDLLVSTGAVCSMRPGTYYFRNITVDGTLNVDTSTGAVTVYFNGILNLKAAGRVNNSTRFPSLLRFYGEQSGNSHVMASTSPVHAYLEEASGTWDITGLLYGHIWGSIVTVQGSGAIHADIGGTNPNAAAHVGWKKPSWARSWKKN